MSSAVHGPLLIDISCRHWLKIDDAVTVIDRRGPNDRWLVTCHSELLIRDLAKWQLDWLVQRWPLLSVSTYCSLTASASVRCFHVLGLNPRRLSRLFLGRRLIRRLTGLPQPCSFLEPVMTSSAAATSVWKQLAGNYSLICISSRI